MRGFKCPQSAARFCRAHDELRNLRARARWVLAWRKISCRRYCPAGPERDLPTQAPAGGRGSMIQGLAACFTGLEDPRETSRCDHQLIDVLVIAV